MEVVPTPEARALMAYLLSLRAGVSLKEAPVILPSTNDVKQATNAAPSRSRPCHEESAIPEERGAVG